VFGFFLSIQVPQPEPMEQTLLKCVGSITMLRISHLVVLTALSTPVWAQTEITPLADVLGNMSPQERQSFDQNISEAQGLSSEVSRAVDAATVSQALEAGLITEEQASAVSEALEIIEANADSFNFDVQSAIEQGLADGSLTMSQVTETLNAFVQLSDAGKALVGNQAFVPEANNQYYSALSDADKAIVDSVSPSN
jgi:uncharacterized membrane protein